MRYDGIYRIASCWRSKGAQGYLVCRYLFIRCDNSPAPWSSEGATQLLPWVLLPLTCPLSQAAFCLACSRSGASRHSGQLDTLTDDILVNA